MLVRGIRVGSGKWEVVRRLLEVGWGGGGESIACGGYFGHGPIVEKEVLSALRINGLLSTGGEECPNRQSMKLISAS